MNILELDSYNLADAVKFNDQLNPRIWAGQKMRPEVRAKLLEIAEDFKEFLGLSDIDVKDITVSGSNANYSYTPYSDIDLHLVVDIPRADSDDVYRELFDAKKYQYNDLHNIKIGNYDVELYVENANKPPVSKGVYSVLNDDWINIPKKVRSEVDDDAVRSKYEDISHRIDQAVKGNNFEQISSLADKIKNMRQAGLAEHGELGPENLAYKMLRTQGKIKELYDARNQAKDKELSLKEQKPRAKFIYGFTKEDADLTWDGVNPTTCMFLNEEPPAKTDEEILKDFINFCVQELKISEMPQIKLRRDPQWSVVNRTFGRYSDDSKTLEVAFGQRHIMDVLRTVAHELTHKHQHERDGEKMGNDAGETGSPWENEANARAGVLMRDYGRLHPDLFADSADIVESASGYIPTKKQAKDPRFSTALTVDIKPGQLGKEANKLKLKTNSQGQPQQLKANGLFERLSLELAQFKRKGTVVESQQLDEVSMRPSTLKQFAQSPEAEGMLAGFEAELIFRDTSGEDNNGDWEPDYDADERVRSLQQIIDFFENDDYGYGLSSRESNRLQERLDEKYFEWHDEQMFAEWQDKRDELIREAWLNERPMAERIHAALVDGMELSDEEADRVTAAGGKAPRFTTSGEEETYSKANKDYEIYQEAVGIAEEVLDEDVEQTLAKEDGFYDEVLDDFRNDFYMDDDSGFFSDAGWRWMSDVADTYDLSWPVMTGGSNGGSRDWEEIGDSLHDAIGMQVKVSSGYHSATRKPDLWIVEPDSSLDPDDREDFGLEIVSPPMPLAQALQKLQQVTDWANGPGNAYTNDSTGLHMGVSIPYKGGDVDYLKLILFLGDEYVLKQFGRESNTYTKAAMKEIRQRAGNEKNAASVMELLKHNLLELAQRELAKSTGEGKYTSAHKQGKYIEFRSAGGDWLAEDSAEPGKLENTMMRYAYAMYLAGRPDLERKEYAKKLYKLVAGGSDDSTMALFSKFATGEINKEQLKKDWARKTLEKDEPSAVSKGNWVVIDNNTGKPVEGQTYNGYTKDEVYQRAKEKLGEYMTKVAFDMQYNIEPQNTGRWEIYRDDHGDDEQLEIIDAPTRGEAVDQAYDRYTGVIPFKVRAYYGDGVEKPKTSPRAKLAKRIIQKPAQPAQAGVYSGEVGDWNLKNRDTGEFLYRINNMNRQDAAQYALNYLRQQGLTTSDYQLLPIGQPSGTPAQQVYSNYDDAQRAADQQNNVQDIPTDVAQNFSTNPNPTVHDANQARASNGVPMWEIYQRDNGHVVHTFADHTQREAWGQAQTWLRNIGAEDASLFSVRPKMLQPGERNLSAPVDATEIPRNWEYVDRITGRVVDTLSYADYNQANIMQDSIERRNPDADIYLRSVALDESKLLDKPEMSIPAIAKKHKVTTDYIKQQLAKGIQVELEHTTHRSVAREIALDHLAEKADYYTKLSKVEK